MLLCDSGKSKTRVCHRESTDGSVLKIRLLKQKIKINMTFGKHLGRETFQTQNKHFTCVKILQASSLL